MHRYLTICSIFLLATLPVFPMTLATQTLRPDTTEKKPEPKLSKPEIKPGFVLVHDPDSISRFKPHPSKVAKAFNAGLLRWTGKSSTADAWQTLVSPGERIGLKISTSGGNITSSHQSLVEAIVQGLMAAGIRPRDIIVWDKNPHHMMSAGFVPMQPDNQWQCMSTIEGSGWDPEVFYFQENVGRLIWGDHEFKGSALPVVSADGNPEPEKAAKNTEQISNRSYFSRILTQKVDKVINVSTMVSHPGVGILGCLSSMALGSIDNHRRFLDGSTASAQAIAEILRKEVISEKVVLHIMDGLIMQFAGGPAFDPNYADSRGFILIGQDPVAMDSWALQQMEYRRQDTSVVPIGTKADHIKAAEAFGLGKHFENTVMTEVPLSN